MNIEEIIKDPDFLGLPDIEKQKVLQSIDTEYSSLPASEQLKVVTMLGKAKADVLEKPDETPEWAVKYPTLYGLLGAAKEVARFGGETAGLIGGGIVGARLGPAGAVGGAALGYGAVKALERQLEGEKATIPEAARTTAKDVATGAAMEMGGQIVGKYAGGVLERISKPQMSQVPNEVIAERMAMARELGIELTPAELTGSKGLALYESMLDKSPFSTSIINTWRELRQLKPLVALREKFLSEGTGIQQTEVLGQQIKKQVNKFLGQYKTLGEARLNILRDNVLKKMGSKDTYEAIGKSTQEAIAARSKEVYDKAGELYKRVGESIPEGTVVKTDKMKEMAARLLQEESKKPVSLQNQQAKRVLEDISGSKSTIEGDIAAYPEVIQQQIRGQIEAEGGGGFDWKTVQSIRSELNSRIAATDAAIKTAQPGAKFQSLTESGIYKRLRKALDEDIQTFADQAGGDVKESFDLANAFYKEGKLTYNAQSIRRMLSSNPEKIVDMIFRPQGGTEVDLITKAIGKDAFEKILKPAFTKRLLDTGEVFNPKSLQANLQKYGDEILRKVYSPKELKVIRDLTIDGKIQMGEKLVGDPFLRTIANQRPEVIVDSILGSYEKFPGSKTVLNNVLAIRGIVDKPTFMSLQTEMSDRIFKLNQITNQVQPEKLVKTIKTYDNVLKIFYSPEQVAWLKQVAETGSKMASAERLASNPSGTAQNVVTWGTWGVIIKSLTSGNLGETASGLFGAIIAPKQMANIYLSKTGRRYFTEGMRTPLGTKRGVEIATNLATIAGDNVVNQTEQ